MTTEDKAREYAGKAVEGILFNDYDKTTVSKKDVTDWAAYDFTNGYVEGQNSRDAEVAGLKAEIKELTEWVDCYDNEPKKSTNPILTKRRGEIRIAWYDPHIRSWMYQKPYPDYYISDNYDGMHFTHWRKI